MKSPFLVAAQMNAGSLEQAVSSVVEDNSSSGASSSSLSSSTSSLNGYSSAGTPPKVRLGNGTPSSSVKSKSKSSRTSKKQQKKSGMAVPDVDALPGSLQLDDDDEPTTTSSSGLSTPSSPPSSSKEVASMNQQQQQHGTIIKTRSRANTRAFKEAERRKKAKRWSNGILVTSALPIIAVLAYDYLQPAHARLSTEHTRQASWHLTTLASKSLHLSYQIPSTASSALANLFHLTNSHDLQLPTDASRTSSILINGLSTLPQKEKFLKGFEDVYVVLLWVAIWTFFREFVIRFICGPIGRYGGIKKTGALQRFGEQGYDVISHLLAVVYGTYIMQNESSGYRNMDLNGLWKDYPHFQLPGNLKLYYLVQMGFWLQQVLTLHLEKRRKDYGQMFIHHIITVSLLYLSYIYNFTRIGNVILVLMDVSDIILGTAKMLKYLGFHENICNIAFGLFMFSWIITRHLLYPKVLLSVIFDSYDQLGRRYDWDPENEWYYSYNTKIFFVILLSALQVLLILWFFMIVKVAVGVLCGKPAEDTRSDDEGESEETASDDLSSLSSSTSSSISSASKKSLRTVKEATPAPARHQQSLSGKPAKLLQKGHTTPLTNGHASSGSMNGHSDGRMNGAGGSVRKRK